MKLYTKNIRRQFIFAAAGLLSVAILFAIVLRAGVVDPVANAQQQGMRLVTVYDRGEVKSFMTAEPTIGDALRVAGVELDERDAVEPAREEKLLAPDYQVNVYRARPIIIIDGSLRQKLFTPYQSSEKIVSDVGIKLHPEDVTKLTRSDDILSQSSGLQLEIVRAIPFELDLYGKVDTVRTQGLTVGEMLEEKGVKLGVNDRVLPSKNTQVTEGMQVRVWREGKQTVTVDEAVDFEVEQIKDADRPVGFKEVKTEGVKGLRSVTYEVNVKDGVEVERLEIASVVKEEATKQVEVIGVKPEHMPYRGTGSKTDWLRASNVPESMWGYADSIVHRESTWNPNAKNKSSGACGLAQALPCSKVPGNPYDPVNSLNWMDSYVNGRYGGWQGAYDFWQKNKWY